MGKTYRNNVIIDTEPRSRRENWIGSEKGEKYLARDGFLSNDQLTSRKESHPHNSRRKLDKKSKRLDNKYLRRRPIEDE